MTSTDSTEKAKVDYSDEHDFWDGILENPIHRVSSNVVTDALDLTVVEEFMQNYEAGLYYDYIEVSRSGARTIDGVLRQKKIKHEIFQRGKAGLMGVHQTDLAAAKGFDSTRNTIVRRLKDRLKDGKGPYQDTGDIFKEMHDLAGIRVALYYPSDFGKVENLIRYNFREIAPPQDWPDRQHGPFPYSLLDQAASTAITGRHSRFPGYFSRHFRVQFREMNSLPKAIQGKTLEIQVMSILMHSWAMINQELVYKPRAVSGAAGEWKSVHGELRWVPYPVVEANEDDQRLLDIANGIVIAGEQVLRQLQMNLDSKCHEQRHPQSKVWKNVDYKKYLSEKWVKDGDMHGLS